MEPEGPSNPPAYDRHGRDVHAGSCAPLMSGLGAILPAMSADFRRATSSPSDFRHSAPSPLLVDSGRDGGRTTPKDHSGDLLNAPSSASNPTGRETPALPPLPAALTIHHILQAPLPTGAEPPLPPSLLPAATVVSLLMGPSSPVSLITRSRPSRWESICIMCRQAEPTWFMPCCITEICQECRYSVPANTRVCLCVAPGFPVPIPTPFRLDSGQLVPRCFVVSFNHPLWQIYRYVEDTYYVLIAYYSTEDAYHWEEFHVRFRVDIICRDVAAGAGSTSWSWRHSYKATLPLGYPPQISCQALPGPIL